MIPNALPHASCLTVQPLFPPGPVQPREAALQVLPPAPAPEGPAADQRPQPPGPQERPPAADPSAAATAARLRRRGKWPSLQPAAAAATTTAATAAATTAASVQHHERQRRTQGKVSKDGGRREKSVLSEAETDWRIACKVYWDYDTALCYLSNTLQHN